MVLVNTFSTYTAKPWLGLLVTPHDRCTMAKNVFAQFSQKAKIETK